MYTVIMILWEKLDQQHSTVSVLKDLEQFKRENFAFFCINTGGGGDKKGDVCNLYIHKHAFAVYTTYLIYLQSNLIHHVNKMPDLPYLYVT